MWNHNLIMKLLSLEKFKILKIVYEKVKNLKKLYSWHSYQQKRG